MGTQGAPERVPERKRTRKVKEGAVCALEKRKERRKKLKGHSKNI
jgi:hypothetical protein